MFTPHLDCICFLGDRELPKGGINDCETTALISGKISEAGSCCTEAQDDKLKTATVPVRGEIAVPKLDINSRQSKFLSQGRGKCCGLTSAES